MPGKHDVFILAMRAESIPEPEGGAGLLPVDIKSEHLIIAQRGFLEEARAYRQIIPYIVFRHDGRIAGYQRTTAAGDKRLHGKVSIGFGGHVDLADVARHPENINIVDLEGTLSGCAQRELAEELEFLEGTSVVGETYLDDKIVANTTPVDEVHIGVVVLVDLNGEGIVSREDELEVIGFKTPKDWLASGSDFETWTELLLKHLVSGAS